MSEVPDVEAIMERIRTEVRETIGEERAKYPRYVPPAAADERSAGLPLIDYEELNFLNAHWHDWTITEELSSHRKFIGPIVVRAKRFIINVIWQYLLKGYLEREKQFHMQLVRYLNANARYVDNRDYEIFWQLIKKMDNDVEAMNNRVDRLVDALHGQLMVLESQNERRAANGRG